ncbi:MULTISPECIES: signal peptidase I [Rhodococcus]|jgi:signal peptidase|uniref:signal peptidase I n=1 Tax=Rhodococcus TaxID=1827 RepID=UPI000A9F65EA|nr:MULTISPECIES: signal peptidase I [Rhodococcus]TSD49272.1 signal peptidase I [Rhodococcus sp. KBS0724]
MAITARSPRAGDRVDGSPRHAAPAPDEHEQSDNDADEKTTIWWWTRTVVSWLLLLVMVGLLAVMVVIPRLTGSTAYTVLTGSMEPTMPPGTLIVVKPTPNEDLATGDVITFQPVSGDPAVVTHRIEGIYYTGEGERRIHTRGDNNPIADSWSLVPEQIRGRVIYSVPQLGRVNTVINGQSRSILVTGTAVALGGYAVWMVISGLLDKRRENGADGEPVDEQGSDADDLQAHAMPVSTTETKIGHENV